MRGRISKLGTTLGAAMVLAVMHQDGELSSGNKTTSSQTRGGNGSF